MIDEKKIEEAANSSAEQNRWEVAISDEEVITLCKKVFKEGAHWAIQEFLKGLWHDAKEEPKEKGYIITKWWVDSLNDTYYECDNIQDRVKWGEYTKGNHIMGWCYLSDILPTQKGGEK